jgi:demethoxyubiquinone hydroxylase (CLK1/Coq7/Cat5 family)
MVIMGALMRPDLLNPLFAEATSLKGVGAGLPARWTSWG